MFVRVCLVTYQEFHAALQLPAGAHSKNLSYDDKKAMLQCLLTKKETCGHKYGKVNRSYKPVEGGEDPLDLAWKTNNKTVLPEEFLWTVLAFLFPIFLWEKRDRLSKLPPSKIKSDFITFVGAKYHFCQRWTEAHLLTTSGQTTVPAFVPSTAQQQQLLSELMKASLEPVALRGDPRKIVMLLQSAGLPAPPMAANNNNNNDNSSSSCSSNEPVSLQIVPATSRPPLEDSFSHLGLGTSYHGSHASYGPGAIYLAGSHGLPFPDPGAASITGLRSLPLPPFTTGANGFPLPSSSAHGRYAQNITRGFDIYDTRPQGYGRFDGLPTHSTGPIPADFVSSNTPHGFFLPDPMVARPVNNCQNLKLPPEALRAAAEEVAQVVAQKVLTRTMPVLEDIREGQNEVVATVKASAKETNDPPQKNDSAEDNTEADTPQLINDPHYDKEEDKYDGYDYGKEEDNYDDYDYGPWLDEYSKTSQFTDKEIKLLCNSSSEDDVDTVLRAIDNREGDRPPCLSFDFISGSGTNENALSTAVSSPSSAFHGHTITSKKWTQTSTGKLLYKVCPAHAYQYVLTESNENVWQTVPGVEELRLTLRVDGAVVVEHLDIKNQVIFSGNLVWKDNKVAQKFTGRHPFTRSKQSVETMLVIESKCLNAMSNTRVRAFLYDFWEQSETDDVLNLSRASLLDAA